MFSRRICASVMRHTYALFRRFDPPRPVSRGVKESSIDSEVDLSPTAYQIIIDPNGTVRYENTYRHQEA